MRKNKKGSKSSVSKVVGWSSAKAQASKMLNQNPNSYFYRHCAPGETQSMGEWSQEEYDLFVEVAKENGCGNSWGLFSSYIPNRVGYQVIKMISLVNVLSAVISIDNLCCQTEKSLIQITKWMHTEELSIVETEEYSMCTCK